MATAAYPYPPYTGGGAEAEAATFTRAQWKELERQAMIYKYMVASVPVPPHLLSSDFSAATPNPTSFGNGYSSIFNLKYGDNKDPEPGRCKRTDGKKWRCSRDVAPQQKYCERHMHRGRPRSRKPVEPQQQQVSSSPSPKTHKKTRLVSSATPPPASSPSLLGSTNDLNNNHHPSSLLQKTVTKTEDVSLSLFTQHSQNRELEWMMETKMMTMETSEQQWHQLMSQGSVYNTNPTDPSIFQHSNYGVEEQQLSLLSLPQIGDSNTDDYNMFMNPYNPPRDFIDAWSNDNNPHSENMKNDSSCGVNNGNLSPCSLSLSMAMGVNDSDQMGQIQMLEEEGSDTSQKCNGLSWLSPVSWMVSAPGGPLAEVLRPSNVIVNSNPGSPCDAISPQATSASSPSGILHRTMLSLSDNSVCNSPTVATAAAPEFVGFQWLN